MLIDKDFIFALNIASYEYLIVILELSIVLPGDYSIQLNLDVIVAIRNGGFVLCCLLVNIL